MKKRIRNYLWFSITSCLFVDPAFAQVAHMADGLDGSAGTSSGDFCLAGDGQSAWAPSSATPVSPAPLCLGPLSGIDSIASSASAGGGANAYFSARIPRDEFAQSRLDANSSRLAGATVLAASTSAGATTFNQVLGALAAPVLPASSHTVGTVSLTSPLVNVQAVALSPTANASRLQTLAGALAGTQAGSSVSPPGSLASSALIGNKSQASIVGTIQAGAIIPAATVTSGNGTAASPYVLSGSGDISSYIEANQSIELTGGNYTITIPAVTAQQANINAQTGEAYRGNLIADSAAAFQAIKPGTPLLIYSGVISGQGQVEVKNAINSTSQPGIYGQISQISGGALSINQAQTFTNPNLTGGAGSLPQAVFVVDPNTFLGLERNGLDGGPLTTLGTIPYGQTILNNGYVYLGASQSFTGEMAHGAQVLPLLPHGGLILSVTGSGYTSLGLNYGEPGAFEQDIGGQDSNGNPVVLGPPIYAPGPLLTLDQVHIQAHTIVNEDVYSHNDTNVVNSYGLTNSVVLLEPQYSGGAQSVTPAALLPLGTFLNGNYYTDAAENLVNGNSVNVFNGQALFSVTYNNVFGLSGIFAADQVEKLDFLTTNLGYEQGRLFDITNGTMLMGTGQAVVDHGDGTNNTFAQGNPYGGVNFRINTGDFSNPVTDPGVLPYLQTLALDYNGTYTFNIAVNLYATGQGFNYTLQPAPYGNFVLVTPPLGINHIVATEPLFLQGITDVQPRTILQLGDGTTGSNPNATQTVMLNGQLLTVYQTKKTNFPVQTSGGNSLLVTATNSTGILSDKAIYEIYDNGLIVVDNTPNAQDILNASQTPGKDIQTFLKLNQLDTISGTGGVEQSGALALTLAGNTNYSGATTIDPDRTLYLKSSSAGASGLPNSIVHIGDGAVFDLSQGDAVQYVGGLDSTVTVTAANLNGSVIANADGTTVAGASSPTGITTITTTNATSGATYIGQTNLHIGNALSTGPDVVYNGAIDPGGDGATQALGQVNATATTGGSVTKEGNFKQTLNGINLYTGSTTINGGTLALGPSGSIARSSGVFLQPETIPTANPTLSSPALEIGGNQTIQDFGGTSGTSLILDGGSQLNFGASNSTQFDGVVTGNGNLNYQGNGTVFTLTGDNPNFIGVTSITSGTFQLGNGGTTGSIGGNVVDNATLVFNHANDVAFNGTISGTGQLIEQGPGNLLLTADNPFTGTTTINTGTLQLGNGGTGGNLAGNIVDNTALVFDRSDSATYGGAISGAGTLSQIGSGTLVLDGNSNLTGGTTVGAGTLVVGDSAHGSASLAGDVGVASGATLSGDGAIGGNVTIASGAHLAPGDSTAALSIGGNLNVAQGGLLDYAFGRPDALLTAQSGLLVHAFGQPNAVPTAPAGTRYRIDVAGNLSFDGAILNITANVGFGAGLYTLFNYGGTLTESNGGILFGAVPADDNLSIQTLTGSKQINLLSVPTGALDFWNGNGLASSSQLGGGDGAWSLTAYNWTNAAGLNGPMQPIPSLAIFAGAPGTVSVDNSAGVVSATGLQFAVDGYVMNGDTLTLVADANGNAPTIRVGDGTTAGASDVATIANVLAGTSGLVKTDYGTLVLTGANTYTGGTTINAGTLQLGNGGTTGTMLGDILDNGTLAVDRSDVLNFDQRISGSGGLTQLGSDTLTLTSANSYTGLTTISAGTLALSATGSIADSSHVVDNSAFDISATTNGASIVSLSGNGTVALGSQTLSLTAAADTFAGVIAGTGGLNLVSGTEILTGSNAYTGATTISGGALQLGNGGASGSVSSDVADNGTLAFDRSDIATVNQVISGSGGVRQIGTGTTILTGNNRYTGVTAIDAGTLQLGNGGTAGALVGDVANNGTFVVDRSDALSFGQRISGAGDLIQQGSGTLTLTGANSYTGLTTISAGTLALSATGSIADSSHVIDNSAFDISATTNGASIVSLSGNGTVNLGSQTLSLTAAADTFAGVIAGTGGLNLVGGSEILTGSNTYAGATTISGGTLQLGNGGASGSVAGDIADNGTLVFDRSDSATVGQAISGSGGVRQAGAGTTILTGTDSYTGGTEVASGDLQVDTPLSSDTVVDAGATLSGTGQVGGLTVNGNLLIGDAVSAAKVFNASHNVVFNPGSQFQVYVDPTGAHSLLQVAGSTVLNGGNVNVSAAGGTYGANQSYEIVQSTGGVSGTFNGVLINNISLAPTLQYQPNGVFLVLNAAATGGGGTGQPGGPQPIALFACAQLTANQCATEHALQAISLQSSTALLPVLNALVTQSLPQARVSLDGLNGQLFADVNMAALHQMSGLRALVDHRATQPDEDDLWFQAHSADATLGNTSQTLAATLDDQGSYAGIQRGFGNGLQMGAFVGDSRTNLNLSNGDHARLSTPQFGLYMTGVFGPNDAWYGNGSLAYGHPQVNTTRYVRVVDPSGQISVASYDQNVTALSLEGGYHGLLGQTHIDPFLAYDGAYVKHGVIDESSHQPSDLTVQGRGMVSSLVSGGLHLSRDVQTAAGTVVPELTLAIARQQGDLQGRANAAFQAAPGIAFTTAGARAGRLLETVSAGASANLGHGWTASLDGTYTHALHENDRGVQAKLALSF